MTNRSGHSPDLPVATFRECDFDPACRYILAVSDGNCSRRQVGLVGIQSYGPRAGAPTLNDDTIAELPERCLGWNAFDLNKVCSGMAE